MIQKIQKNCMKNVFIYNAVYLGLLNMVLILIFFSANNELMPIKAFFFVVLMKNNI